VARAKSGDAWAMSCFLIRHSHDPSECRVVFAAFKGFDTPLRHRPTIASCDFGGHTIWWTVKAADEGEALALLPYYVAQRATATRIREVEIP
jgi:hypothetical protein